MPLLRWQILVARLLFVGYILFTGIYCLLAYVPFTYQQIHIGQLFPWLTTLVSWHAALFWPAFVAASMTVMPALKDGPGRYLAWAFAITGALAGILLLFHPFLPNLRNDGSSLIHSLLAFVPLVWIAAIDCRHDFRLLAWSPESPRSNSRLSFATATAPLLVASIYFLVACSRLLVAQRGEITFSTLLLTLFSSLLSQSLLFVLIFVLFDFAASLGSALGGVASKIKITFLFALGVSGVLLGLTIRNIILPPLSVGAPISTLIAGVVASSLVLYAAGTAVRICGSGATPLDQGLDLLFAPFRFVERASRFSQLMIVALIPLVASLLSIRASHMDWEFSLQKITVLLVWVLSFAVLYVIAPRLHWFSRARAYALGFVILTCFVGLNEARHASLSTESLATPVDQFTNYDVSFRLANEILRSQLAAQNSNVAPFYSFLAQNTNIPRSTRLNPVDIHLVENLKDSFGLRPNIFMFVVDSLRRDYLSPYNQLVTFTPQIGSFARDSIVFENAFTRYGGTGLSEPSIWVGGLIPHQQYTEPFAPMNSLQKLLEANQYREWISKDNVLQQVVPASPNIDELDKNIGAMSYDLCRTLQEVTTRLPYIAEGSPVFVYTQAQNIHVSVIDRDGRSVLSGASSPAGFDAAYASRLQRIDRCLGTFFQSLRDNHLYDHSIIVLTSDHGDSLGEGGRWGHAYTIFPEIMRVPLIIHLPTAWRDRLQYDPESLAFLTDITPSLYYLLNQQPLTNNPVFGRPLITKSMEEQKAYMRDAYVMISSYAPVYGLLTEQGHRLYIADGVNYKDYAYAIDPNGSSRQIGLGEEERNMAQSQIRRQVGHIAQFYGLPQ